MIRVLDKKRILLGVSGSVAAYKAADLASKLTQAGAIVRVILTEAAQQFISPLTFQSVTSQKAYTDHDLWSGEGHVLHIGLGNETDLMVIAPASANTIARLANGMAENFLCLTALTVHCPIIVAPAMDSGMYIHPATQANLATLRERGIIFAGPAEGRMASGLIGLGRMVEPTELVGMIRFVLGKEGELKGKRVVVTAGGTVEPIDSVRAITNRSTGKQGFAVAQAALDHGAIVTLIAANSNLPTPVGAERIEVKTASEMRDAVINAIPNAEALIMAAAVADFQPIKSENQKIKKEAGIPEIRLTYTTDILTEVSQYRERNGFPRIVIGFAAESEDLIQNASQKLKRKKLDLIVANDISAKDAGFAVDTNRVTLLYKNGQIEDYPLMQKDEVAELIIERLIQLFRE
ncbi:MAG: bifunctional phosphopantothenoylcysteine decarboxylase/phosphopantothenate--cysteine ligase CoaBC [Anaerolineales bacterium]